MKTKPYNCVFLMGPTACGKTAIGAALANFFSGEIISADSRQVYKELTIGSGKDLNEYEIAGVRIPYHLIDIADLKSEYNLFRYQKDFYRVFPEIIGRKKLPIVVGGTGMYLDAIIRNYDLIETPFDEDLHNELLKKELPELNEMLLRIRPDLHTREDLRHKERCIRAIEIASFMKSHKAEIAREKNARPDIRPLAIETSLERDELRKKIKLRLSERMQAGLIYEVEAIHESGISWERLESLGLEYKFVARFLQKKIPTQDELFEKLYVAICKFAKRQETWFRGMEKKMQAEGIPMRRLSKVSDKNERIDEAKKIISNAFGF